MMTFDRKTGTMIIGGLIARGIWSGHGDARNDVGRESEKGVGPIPAGVYNIGNMLDGGHLGPHVMALTAIEGNQYGRSGFYIHGDHANDTDNSASDGCIIAPRLIRDEINKQKDRRLQVT